MCLLINFCTVPHPTLPERRIPDYHNEIRYLFASLMKKVGHDFKVEPHLQARDNETFTNSTFTADEEKLDISATKIWGSHFERSFNYVKIFIPYAPTNRIKDTEGLHLLHENLKRLKYQDRIVEIEYGSYSPLIFATTCGASPITQKLIRRIASFIAQISNELYPEVINFIRTRVSFNFLKSTFFCIRGCRGQKSKTPDDISIETFKVEIRS